MLQIIGLLGCAYLVFKGFEILMLALTSDREERASLITLGALAFLASIIVAAFFF